MVHIKIDLSGLKELSNIDKAMKDAAMKANQELAKMAYQHAVTLADQKLKSTKEIYIKALSLTEVDGIPVIELDTSATWIEQGQKPYSIAEKMLAKSNKTNSKGEKYAIVPFQHDKNQGKGRGNAGASSSLIQSIKSELANKKIPWSDIEKHKNGKPKIGKLHSFNVNTKEKGPTGIPYGQGVNIYQKKTKEGKVERSIMTFRTISEKHIDQSRWKHPGTQPANILEETSKWLVDQFEKTILPKLSVEILAQLK